MPPRRIPHPSTKLTLAPRPTHGFDRKLLAYALAGGAAAAPASAAVVYSGPQGIPVTYGTTQPIDFAVNGIGTDFTLEFDSSLASARLVAFGGSMIAKSGPDAARFLNGDSIDSTRLYGSSTKNLASYSGAGGAINGGTFPAGTSFVGLKIANGSDSHFGWIQVTLPANTSSPLTIVDWAHETTVGQAILAGQTSSTVPEAGSTALFSLGAAGLCVWRARKRARRA